MPQDGLFLSLDGIDGGGKSTQCRRLAEWLRGAGHEVVEAIDPGGTALGQQLRSVLLAGRAEGQPIDMACEALLFMASRAQLVAEVIRPALGRGAVVLSDRYLLATVVYQGHAGGLDVPLLWEAGRLSTGGVMPERTFVLDLPLDEALARRARPADRIEGRARDYHERVRQGFLNEARRQPERIVVLDARPGPEEVQAELRRQVSELLAKRAQIRG